MHVQTRVHFAQQIQVSHKIGSIPTGLETTLYLLSKFCLRWFHRGEGVRPARVQAGIPDDTLHCPSGRHPLLLHQEPDVGNLEMKDLLLVQHHLEVKQ